MPLTPPVFAVTDHKLAGIPFAAAHAWRNQDMEPTLIILHDTAGQLRPRSSVEWFLSPECTTSAHIVVERDGSVTQLVPFNKVAFHAGQSNWQGRPNCNGFSIGIEIVNPGKLTKSGTSAKAYFGVAWPLEEVEARTTTEHGAGYWMPYTAEQVATVTALCRALCQSYPIEDITTHWAVSPGRKVDPNPLFPLAEVKAAAFAADATPEVPITAAIEPTVLRAGVVTAADLKSDGSRSVTWIDRILIFIGLSGSATGTFTLTELMGAFKGTRDAVKTVIADKPSIILFMVLIVLAVVAAGIGLARHYLVEAAREGRYDPKKG